MTASEPLVVAGLARPRAGWFAEVGDWAATSRLPITFLRCVSAAELRGRIVADGLDAVMVDPDVTGVDAALWQLASRERVPIVIVAAAGAGPEASGIPPDAALLRHGFTEEELLAALRSRTTRRAPAAAAAPAAPRATTAAVTGRASKRPAEAREGRGPAVRTSVHEIEPAIEHAGGRTGRASAPLIALVGPGGCGTSTIAIAVAQGFAERTSAPDGGLGVALADVVVPGSLAMYHDAGDVVPGLPELVDACRAGSLVPARRLLYEVDRRGYSVLLGCRSRRDRDLVDAPAVNAALGRLREEVRLVVADTDPTIVGDGPAGSGIGTAVDRLAVGRAVVRSADVVLLCATPELRAVHEMLRLEQALVDAGVPVTRIVRVLNRAPRRRGGGIAASDLAALSGRTRIPTVAVPRHRAVEGCHVTGDPLPGAVVRPLVEALRSRIEIA